MYEKYRNVPLKFGTRELDIFAQLQQCTAHRSSEVLSRRPRENERTREREAGARDRRLSGQRDPRRISLEILAL